MKNVRLTNPRGVRLSLSNIACGNGYDKYASVIDLYDTVDDSRDAVELLSNIKKLNLLGFNNPYIDKENDRYVRLRGTDSYGNIHYLIVES